MSSDATVLHVDDDPSQLELSTLSFRSIAGDDVEMVTAASAEDGLELLEERSVDCLVSDSLRLEDDTPFIVAARRRDDSLPIIFYTAKQWNEVALDAIDARVSEYVRKADSGGVTTVAERAYELATERRNPSVDEETLFEGRPCESVDEAAEAFPAEVGEGPWTVIGVHDWQSDDELGTTIARVLESHTGTDALDAEPLFESIDAESLEKTLQPRIDGSSRYDIQVRFPYVRWEIAVSSDGFVAIRDLPETGDE